MARNAKVVTEDDILYMDEFSTDNKNNGTQKFSDRLLETDNTYNPKPTYGPEIDDLEPGDYPPDGESDDRGIDDGFLPERPKNKPPGYYPNFPKNPGQADPEFTPGFVPGESRIPDVNVYQQKKTIAEGMLVLALTSANANQFRYVLQSSGTHPFYYPSLAMIGFSLILQIAVGFGLIWNSRYNVKVEAQMCKANTANNWTFIGVFFVTILNVFISSFGVAGTLGKS